MHVAGVRAPRDGRRERRREPLQHRRVEQEALERRAGRPRQHLLGQVVEVGPPVASRARARPVAAAGPGRQQQPGDPALGALVQLADLGLGQLARARPPAARRPPSKLKASSSSPITVAPPAAAREASDARASRRPVIARCTLGGRSAARRPRASATGPRLQRVDVVERQHEVVRDRRHELVGERGDLVLGRAAGRQGRRDARERLGDPGGDVGHAASRACAGAGRTRATPTAAGRSPAPAPAGSSCRSRPRRRAASTPARRGRGARGRPAPGRARCWAAGAEAAAACAARRPECSRTARHRSRSSSWILGHGGKEGRSSHSGGRQDHRILAETLGSPVTGRAVSPP